MTTNNAIIYRILNLCEQHQLTVNGLATISAVPPSTLKNILNGTTKNPGIITIKKLCDGLNITLIEFFNTDLFKSLEQEIK